MEKSTHNQNVGRLGEDIASKYLKNKGYTVVCRNYRKKYGEIDIVAKNKEKLHFVEVKTVSVDLSKAGKGGDHDTFRPEDNVHLAKMSRLANTIEVYLIENRVGEEALWQFDVVTVLLDEKNKLAKVELIEDVIL